MTRLAAVVLVLAVTSAEILVRTGSLQELRTPSLGVSDNLYLISGGGGNALMMTRDQGVVIVDALLPDHGRALLDMAHAISDQPVTTAIYTHAHVDHTGSSRELPELTEIIAHENTKAIMEQMDAFKGANARFLPNKTFRDALSIGADRDRIDLYYFGAAHTSGDILVVFPGKRAALLGDLFPGKTAPIVDAANGGSLLQWPQTLTRVIGALQGIARIIPGHGLAPTGSPLGRWITMADLQEFAALTGELVPAVRAAHAAGKTVDEAAPIVKASLLERHPSYNFDDLGASVLALYAELSAAR